MRARRRGKECGSFLDPASLTAALHGEVLDLLLEPLIAEAAQHDAGTAHSPARQVSVPQSGIELGHFKGAAKPERISYLSLFEHLLPVRQRLTLVTLHRSDLGQTGQGHERVGALLQFLVNRHRLVVLLHIKIELCQLVLELGR